MNPYYQLYANLDGVILGYLQKPDAQKGSHTTNASRDFPSVNYAIDNSYLLNARHMDMAPEPAITTKIAGNMQNTSGKSILTGSFAAVSRAR